MTAAPLSRRRLDLGDGRFLILEGDEPPTDEEAALVEAIGRRVSRLEKLAGSDAVQVLSAAIETGDRRMHAADNFADRSAFDDARAALLLVEEALAEARLCAEALAEGGDLAVDRLAAEGLVARLDALGRPDARSRVSERLSGLREAVHDALDALGEPTKRTPKPVKAAMELLSYAKAHEEALSGDS